MNDWTALAVLAAVGAMACLVLGMAMWRIRARLVSGVCLALTCALLLAACAAAAAGPRQLRGG